MTRLLHGWTLEVDRGPDWVFLHPCPPDSTAPRDALLADDLWEIVQQHCAHRLVVDLHDVDYLNSHLLGQLVLLHKRIHSQGGIMRICGLNPAARRVLECARLDERFPHYETRDDAVRGSSVKPR